MFSSMDNSHKRCKRKDVSGYKARHGVEYKVETNYIVEEEGEEDFSMLRKILCRLNQMAFMLIGYLAMKRRFTMLITDTHCKKGLESLEARSRSPEQARN